MEEAETGSLPLPGKIFENFEIYKTRPRFSGTIQWNG